ncbi:hypothetical protein LTV02_26225 [Nocardia yamanashiensis]|uniref:LppU/SCO3897 family protein n=1 Tax=Nocardia yamanashiensis TaxID=209247 RepID=UPI001E2FCA50|nr:hypothetical protein [Nocardia yamanashiensis]UGT39546.1 hypothetical protein LTV02_26225 [Nocardia yamanashiensis]
MIAALRTASQRISHSIDTRDLLVALMRVDESANWSRIRLHAGDIDAIAGKVALDPLNRSTADWNGTPVTGSCAAALDVAARLAGHYNLWPLPPGMLALGLVADESSSAAQVLGNDLGHGELLRLIQDEVLGVALHGLDAVLPAMVAAARETARRRPAAIRPPQQYPVAQPAPPPPPIPAQPQRPVPVGTPGRLYCRVCGSTPAVQVGFSGHQGFLIRMAFLSVTGPFCRDCGLATYRSMTAKTLWQGWWGPLSAFINPIVVLSNVVSERAVLRLPPPIPGAPGIPLDPGKPVRRRPSAIAGMLAPFLVVAAVVTNIELHERAPDHAPAAAVTKTRETKTYDVNRAQVGDCLDVTASGVVADAEKVSCADSRARSRVMARLPQSADSTECSARGAAGYYRTADALLCLRKW